MPDYLNHLCTSGNSRYKQQVQQLELILFYLIHLLEKVNSLWLRWTCCRLSGCSSSLNFCKESRMNPFYNGHYNGLEISINSSIVSTSTFPNDSLFQLHWWSCSTALCSMSLLMGRVTWEKGRTNPWGRGNIACSPASSHTSFLSSQMWVMPATVPALHSETEGNAAFNDHTTQSINEEEKVTFEFGKRRWVATLCPTELLPQDTADFELRSQRKCIIKAEQHNRGEGDNTERVRCVNGINKEFIQIDPLFLITHNPASSLLQAELKTKQQASLCVFLNFLPSGKNELINKMKGNS